MYVFLIIRSIFQHIKFYSKLILLCLLFISFIYAFGQHTKQYQFRRVDISKGLSNNKITTIFKDGKGFMWFGTMSGLNRYDGHEIKIFRHDPLDSSSIDDDYISRIWEIPNQKMLVTTHNRTNIYDPLTEKFDHKTLAYFAGLSLPDTTIINVVKTLQGDFYFLFAGKGLYKYNHSTGQSAPVNLPGSSAIAAFSQNASGDLWLIRGNGMIEKLNTKTDRIIYRSPAMMNFMHGEVFEYALMADQDDELWLYPVSVQAGMFYFRPTLNELVPVNKESVNSG